MKKMILASLLAFGFTASAMASEDGSGAYAGLAYGNTAFSDDGAIAGNLRDDSDKGLKVYGGYQFNKIVGVEATYTDYGKYTYDDGTTLEATAISVGANLGYTFLDGQLRPYALVGLSYLTLDQSTPIYDDDKTISYTYGVGIEYSPKVLNGVGFRAAWNTDIYIVDSSGTGDDYDAQGFGMLSVAVQYKF